MRKIRNCNSSVLLTGGSKCPINYKRVIGAIAMYHGHKLPANLTAETLEELCHADGKERAFLIYRFVEYAREGGEPNVSSVGYGGDDFAGLSNRKDTFTMKKYNEVLAAYLLKVSNVEFDVYYFDEDNVIYGINDGTDTLAGIPMNCIYPTATPHPTSSDKSTLTVTFSLTDAQEAIEEFDFEQLDFKPGDAGMGLVPVKLVQTTSNSGKYKIVELYGGYDRTAEFGSTIATAATAVLSGVTAAEYSAVDETITITAASGATPTLKSSSVLYTNDIKGIEAV